MADITFFNHLKDVIDKGPWKRHDFYFNFDLHFENVIPIYEFEINLFLSTINLFEIILPKGGKNVNLVSSNSHHC